MINPSKVYIALKYHVVKGDDDPLTHNDFVTPLQVTIQPPTINYFIHKHLYTYITFIKISQSLFIFKPLSHCAIESYVLNLGECNIYEITKLYPIWAKLHFMLDVTKEAKETFRKFFEGYTPSINEEVSNQTRFKFDTQVANQLIMTDNYFFLLLIQVLENISTSFKPDNTPTTKQAEVAQKILNKEEQYHVFQLDGPLSSFGTLLLNDLEISITITFTDNLNFFCSHVPNVKPKIMIDEIR